PATSSSRIRREAGSGPGTEPPGSAERGREALSIFSWRRYFTMTTECRCDDATHHVVDDRRARPVRRHAGQPGAAAAEPAAGTARAGAAAGAEAAGDAAAAAAAAPAL